MAPPRQRRTGSRIALIAALVALIAAVLVGAALSGNDAPAQATSSTPASTAPPTPTIPPATPHVTVAATSERMLLPGNREILGICVQATASASLTEDAAREHVATAFELVKQADYWPDALDRERTTVDAGCPTVAALLHPEHPTQPTSKGGNPDVEHRVERPSPYLVHVIVLSDDELRSVFGSIAMRVQVQEMQCTEHRQCWQVTTGLYLTDRELADTAFVTDWLSKSIGFVPPVPPSPSDPDAVHAKETEIATNRDASPEATP